MKTLATFLCAALMVCNASIAQDNKDGSPVSSASLAESDPVFEVRGDVTPPRTRKTPDPKTSKQQNEWLKDPENQGTVILWLIVSRDGNPRNVKVARSLRPDLDESAVEAVKHWKFKPATKQGKPVSVSINVEIHYRPS